MPNRDIKESCRTSPTLAQLTHGAERLFWRMTTCADDFGRMPADAVIVRAECFPRLLERVSVKDVDKWIDEMRRVKLVHCYTDSAEHHLLFFLTWRRHQRQRAKHSKYEAPSSANTCRHMLASAGIRSEDTVVPETTEDTVTTALSVGHAERDPTLREQASSVLAFLNLKTGHTYRLIPTNLRLIEACLASGATVENCRGVIARKVREWSVRPEMRQYLRPATLFNATKFEQYLGERENGHHA